MHPTPTTQHSRSPLLPSPIGATAEPPTPQATSSPAKERENMAVPLFSVRARAVSEEVKKDLNADPDLPPRQAVDTLSIAASPKSPDNCCPEKLRHASLGKDSRDTDIKSRHAAKALRRAVPRRTRHS
ncbi:hypothetical protein VOLCADRAFT_91539 [Volvox carteri f. nagariensis]|uniref:Uncharacterized protein n=1 Tax=Volvox carteri f. nagariensis TaxID=3068 RepID=D8TXC3_VOLCA|nr:uncharacterized protein VOLCADRAFT_91539 [Volvox carteri f. nagariensis]EFJ47886.1 hypothetical protein VOLCADRAFT_91539 [Volvox carteri f. nagariensis]|eukprot:XP_002950992.1 hypothetical protein VOLCADRAFT_91539 [Volvox carteri f. nagariensis]